jgi:hypothetical protein
MARLGHRATQGAPLPAPDSIAYALRDSQGHLLLGDAQLPPRAMTGASQVFAITQIDGAACAL